MKNTPTVSLLLLCLLLAWTGCSDKSNERALIERAAYALENAPDRAITILDSIPLPEELTPSLASEWSLLYARAADQLGSRMPYVSQLQVAVNYFRETHRPRELAEAYLYLGRSYLEDKLFEKALQAYQAGLQAALQAKDYNRAGYICSYWGSLYEEDGNYQQGIEKFEQSNGYFQQAGNHKSYAFGLVNESHLHLFMEHKQQALSLMKQADSVAVILDDPEVQAYVYNGLANVYCELEKYDLAEVYVYKGMALDSLSVENYSLLYKIYLAKGDLNKAEIYLGKSKQDSDDELRLAGINYKYYQLSKYKNNIEKALFYLEKYVVVLDSINTIENQIDLTELENKYKHVLLENENIQLKQENQKKYFLLLMVLSGSLFLIVIYLLTLKRKNQCINSQQQKIIKQNHEIYIKTIELQQKKEELQQQALRVEESRRLLHLQDTFEEEQARYILLKEQVESLNSYLNEKKSDYFLQSSVAKRLQKLAQTVKVTEHSALISERYWLTIETLVAEVYPILQQKLFALSVAELHICYLTLFRFDTKSMAVLLGILPDSVNKQRLRVRQKLGLTGSERDLYDYLVSP